MRHLLLAVAASLAVAAPAAAQKLNIEFREGRVTVDAASVPVRTILTEWSKIGGTKVIGGERIAGAPLTIKLVDVPESQALEVILRSVAGYMAAPRHAGEGASMYDRILVMATSTPPAPAAAPARPAGQNPNAMSGTQRFVPPRRDPQEQADEQADDADPNPPNPPVFTFPQPGQGGVPQPGQFNNGQFPANGQPVIMNPSGMPPGNTINPAQPTFQPAAPVGLPAPGMIAPTQPMPGMPQPPPGTTVRPPGGR